MGLTSGRSDVLLNGADAANAAILVVVTALNIDWLIGD